MKKFIKINSVLLFIFMFFSFAVPFTHAVETRWGYTDSLYVQHANFFTEADCKKDNDAFLKSKVSALTTTVCASYVVTGLPIPAPVSQDAVNVDAKINVPENNTVYKMLAPIGTITCMDWATPKDPNSKCIGNNIGEYLNVIFKFAIGLCAALAVIMLIISGITYMGDESIFAKTEAKSKMFSAILGLIIALGSYAILNTINPDLTGTALNISAVNIQISADDTSTGSSTSLCLSSTPPNPDSATGTNITLSPEMTNEYIPERDKIVGMSTGTKLLITAQTAVEGFKKGTKSYRTNNPGNIGNTDNGATVPYTSLMDGIKKQQSVITNVAADSAKSYKIGGKSTCALGSEAYSGYLYQYLRIYATGARTDNNYLNAIIGYFKSNGKIITARTTIADIYAMN
jgi:hypothetical protein